MTDKQLKERKREFFDLVDKYYHNSGKESSGEDWLLWDWISKLVEEVEREKEIKGFYQFISFIMNYLDENYPKDIFNGSSGDSGAVLIAKIRKAIEDQLTY